MRLGSKRRIFVRSYARKKAACCVVSAVCVLLLLCTAVYALSVMRPTFVSLAENRAKELALQAINESVSQMLSQTYEYGDIVEIERTEDNKISAVKSKLVGVSKLKSDLSLNILQKITELDQNRLKIPLGSLMGSDIFAGCGPELSFQIKPYGSVAADIHTDFTEAGINQTKCDVTVSVKADMSILMPTVSKKSTVETTVPIVQTVIVGDIPESYTNVDRDGYPFEDDVLQLAGQ